MRISKRRIHHQRKKEILELLWQTIADTKDKKEAKLLLENLLSKTELAAISKRLGIIYCLDQGYSYQKIANRLKVSSATIATLAEDLNKKGYQEALKKIKAEEWASRWAGKINSLFKQKNE